MEWLQDRSEVLLRLSDQSLVPPLSRADEVKHPIPAPSPGIRAISASSPDRGISIDGPAEPNPAAQ